eukprot:CAMPEP_0185829418 /NCGR_PEP_ID=MMETSP1353-20130828/235_1 /TAXON_ID=1077150 /ORGANISM="Erythrolobus australicus, Strain CCMP3124" /LENGTH=220 /DNA_ID=CAMNT_0028527207 /DNA_START=234 /DNA_END=896 /DNA_ORIENTATION=-
MKALGVAVVVVVAALGLAMVMPGVSAELKFMDLPCGVESCDDGVEIENSVMKARFETLASSYVSLSLMTQLKANTLTEFFYSALQHGPSGSSYKCLRDADIVRAVRVLRALVPPPSAENVGAVSRMWHQVKSAVGLAAAPGEKAALTENSAVREQTVSATQCGNILTGRELYCEATTCAALTGPGSAATVSEVTNMYWLCCQTYYSVYYGWYCGINLNLL